MTGSSFFIDFYKNIDLFLLIFIRILGFIIILPVFAGVNFPNVTKIAFTFSMAFLVYTTGLADTFAPLLYDGSVIGYSILILREFFVGFILGFSVYLIFSLLYFAGQFIDFQIGLSMSSVYDPLSQIQVPIFGNLLYLVICAFLFHSNGMFYLFEAFFASFRLIPVNTADILGNEWLITELIDVVVKFYVIAVQISLPIVSAILLVDVALGLLVKAVPHMNIFVVGMPLKLLIGFAVMFVIVPIFGVVYEIIFKEAFGIMQSITLRLTG